ncbi:MAG: type II toxin-antitoxin system RelB/DinJ family antitoxin [Parafannyhessea sp.]|uniref:type II toxin-antitoxin system RelB/DinJ family antitoxin n=1 Tax=Parafannyhessea sp. TaxID=2847324 RepID=UPI003F092B30
MATVELKVRIDKDTRDEMQRIASNLGMSVNTAFSMFAKQFVMHRGLPFDAVERVQAPEVVMDKADFIDEMERRYFAMKDGNRFQHELVEA